MADEFRNGFYAGVHYLVENGEAWYKAGDVVNVLDCDEVRSSESLRHVGFDDDDGDYIPSDVLAHAVDKIIGFRTETMHQLWVSAWYDDLTFHAEFGEGSPDVFGGDATGDFLIGLIEANRKAVKTEDAARIAAVAGVMPDIEAALDDIGDALSFIDGMRTVVSLSPTDDRAADLRLSNLYDRICSAEVELERANRQLEDIVEVDHD